MSSPPSVGIASTYPPSTALTPLTNQGVRAGRAPPSIDVVHQSAPSSTSASATKRTPGCHRCRERHVKCNKERPICSNCRQARSTSPCRYERKREIGVRFRQSRYSSDVSARPAFSGAASRNCGVSAAHPPADSELKQGPTRNGPDRDFIDRAPLSQPRGYSPVITVNSLGEIYTAHSREMTARCGSSPEEYSQYRTLIVPYVSERAPAPESPWQDADTNSPLPSNGRHRLQPVVSKDKDLSPRVLNDSLDCKIFDFYIQHVGHWIDIGSPNHYFQHRIPRLALLEPLLLYACLSCASHIMSLVGKIGKSVEEHYRGKVLELLIPLLSSDQATSSNEVLLATTIILRMSEQFEEVDTDALCHLNGAASLLTDGTDWSPVESSLAIACFWTYLRESIRVCFLTEQPCPIDLDQLSLREDDMTWAPRRDSDECWTNRITYLLLRICNLCWGPAAETSGLSLAQLQSLLDSWRQNIPLAFQPWCAWEADDQPFPKFQCFESLHVVAWQFYYTARTMLALHSADYRRRTRLEDFTRHVEADILTPARWLCGLCFSSTANVGTNLNGSHLMAWCGQLLPGKDERRALRNFLQDLGKTTGWPVAASCLKLDRAWKGSERSWADC